MTMVHNDLRPRKLPAESADPPMRLRQSWRAPARTRAGRLRTKRHENDRQENDPARARLVNKADPWFLGAAELVDYQHAEVARASTREIS